MQIELALFIGILLSGWLLLAFVLESINDRHFTKIKKEIQLTKKKCEICTSVYFVSVFFEFWRCPVCGNINKESSD
jgi:rubrerythrin